MSKRENRKSEGERRRTSVFQSRVQQPTSSSRPWEKLVEFTEAAGSITLMI